MLSSKFVPLHDHLQEVFQIYAKVDFFLEFSLSN